MQVAVQDCYRQLNGILQRFGADSSQAFRETFYTTDMDALIKALPDRKTFFADACTMPGICLKWSGRCACASSCPVPAQRGRKVRV